LLAGEQVEMQHLISLVLVAVLVACFKTYYPLALP
jgi:NO-binding membrane sensor protein with MHYT domain